MDLLGTRIDDMDDATLDGTLNSWLQGNEAKVIATPNPEILLKAQKDTAFRGRLNQSDLNLADGVGLRFAVAALTDEALPHRHTGVDILERLASLCASNGKRLALFGGERGSSEGARHALIKTFPSLDAVAIDPGPLSENASLWTFQTLIAARPAVLAVALGAGKQEAFVAAARAALPTLRIGIGVGGAFEMLAKQKPRAPAWLRRMGFEWLWRVLIEPKRARRIANAVIVFPLFVAWSTLKSRRFFKACQRVFPEIFRQLRGQ